MPDQIQSRLYPGRHGLRGRVVVALLAATIALAALTVAAPSAGAAQAGTLGPKAARLVELLNRERRANGLAELRVLPRLVQMARAHSADMGAGDAPCQEPYLHHNPNLADQVQPAGAWGENVACAGDPDEMHQAWMNSPGHRRNILGDWNVVGVGTFDGSLLWGTQDFAKVSSDEFGKALSPSQAQAPPTTRAPTATTRRPAAPAATQTPAEPATIRKAMIRVAHFEPRRDWPAVACELRRICQMPKIFGA